VKSFVPANTVVIAAAVSNGGGASLRAAEQDSAGWIDAVVVGEPQVSVNVAFPQPQFSIQRGAGPALPGQQLRQAADPLRRHGGAVPALRRVRHLRRGRAAAGAGAASAGRSAL
jgi:hypothetical protein